MARQVTVFCTIQIEGAHFWKDCPLAEVDYLKDRHRHVFHIKAYQTVSHSDRDVEFICLKHDILHYLRVEYFREASFLHEFDGMSCEMIANELIDRFNLSSCEVNEDGENGAIVTA